jgi:hypothetical protein
VDFEKQNNYLAFDYQTWKGIMILHIELFVHSR